MYELKKNGKVFLGVNLLGPGTRLMKKEFTGPRSHKGLRNSGLDGCGKSHPPPEFDPRDVQPISSRYTA